VEFAGHRVEFGPVSFGDGQVATAAPVFARLQARGIDSFITGALAGVVSVVFGAESLYGDGVLIPVGAVLFPFAWATIEFVYDLGCEALTGRTLGKLMLGLRVVEANSGTSLAWRVALLRAACPLLAFTAPFAAAFALGLLALPALVIVLALAGPLLEYWLVAPRAVLLAVKLSFLGAAREATGRGWHDRRAHTVVIVTTSHR